MPTYRIPVNFYVEAVTVADAAYKLAEYLDYASHLVTPLVRGGEDIMGVDVEVHQAEECPPVPAED